MAESTPVRALLQLSKGPDWRVGGARIQLLETIAEKGSISAAAKAVGLSYKGAWDAVQALNNLFELPLVVARPGGRAGGTAEVTPAGEALISAFHRLEMALSQATAQLGEELAGGGPLDQLAWSLSMKTSARNALRGEVVEIRFGAVNAEVRLKVSDFVEIVAIITRDSAEDLDLTPGRAALALIKSSFVILAVGDEPLRTSARNCLAGVVVRHERGTVNDEVVLEIDDGKTITATITRESADTLGIEVGARAKALIKASHVILAVD
jgi:molybdate transport system regulatory protein